MGLEGLSCEERLGTPGLSGVEKRKPRGGLMALGSFPRRGGAEGGAGLCSLVSDGRVQKGTELRQGRARLGVSRNVSATRVVTHRDGLPGEATWWCPVPVSALGTFGQCPR